MEEKGKEIQRVRQYSIGLALMGALFYIPFLGGVHLFDWDEINFAEISREMLITKNYFQVYVNFEPFFEKPPFFFWLQVLSMNLFGVNEFAARFPNALIGIINLVLLFRMGQRLFDLRFGLLWSLVWFGTVLPFLYSKSGIIDPVFNLFMFLGIYQFIRFNAKRNIDSGYSGAGFLWVDLLIAGFWIGMAILCKGQVAYLIVCLCFFVYWVYERFRFYVSLPQFLFFTFAVLLVMGSWFGLSYWQNGSEFIVEFTKYQIRLLSTEDAGHKGFPGYHMVILLVGCFPASIFAIRSFFKMPQADSPQQQDFIRWMKILFWVVLILFSLVQSKIVHYSSMCYYPLSFLATYVIYSIWEAKIEFKPWMKNSLIALGLLFALVVFTVAFLGNSPELLKNLFKDPFAQAALSADANWTGWEYIPGLLWLGLLFFAFRRLQKTNEWSGWLSLFGGSALFVLLTLIFFIRNIEAYSQKTAIEWYESKVGEDCYIVPMGHRTYAHLFYTKRPGIDNPKAYNNTWLFWEDIDKDVYIVTKVHKAKPFREIPGFEEVASKNGFIFLKRPKDHRNPHIEEERKAEQKKKDE